MYGWVWLNRDNNDDGFPLNIGVLLVIIIWKLSTMILILMYKAIGWRWERLSHLINMYRSAVRVDLLVMY